jgi:hypothetical protein
MRSGRQQFLASAEAQYQARIRRTWAALKPGDRIFIEIDGGRADVTVVGAPYGEEIEVEHHGIRRVVNRYQFCALSLRVAGGCR